MEIITIGKINNTHGLTGEVSVQIDSNIVDQLKPDSFLFVALKNQSFIPHRIVNIRKESSQHFIIQFKGFDNIDLAKSLIGKLLGAEAYKIDKKEALLQSNYLSSYKIEDITFGIIGPILQIVETAGQMLAFVDYKGTEVIIPMNPAIIIAIKEEENIIIMNLPEGLLDIYLHQ